jgi:hypothetical protein
MCLDPLIFYHRGIIYFVRWWFFRVCLTANNKGVAVMVSSAKKRRSLDPVKKEGGGKEPAFYMKLLRVDADGKRHWTRIGALFESRGGFYNYVPQDGTIISWKDYREGYFFTVVPND